MSSFVTGQIVEARCSRCKDITGHVIMACVDGVPVKVECRACGSVHKYVAPGIRAHSEKEATVSVRAGRDRTLVMDAAVHAEAVRAQREDKASRPTPLSREEKKLAQRREQAEQQWQKAVSGIVGEAVPYTMSGSFSVDALVEHPIFGMGIVLEVFPPDKMEVLFREGVKRLRCAC